MTRSISTSGGRPSKTQRIKLDFSVPREDAIMNMQLGNIIRKGTVHVSGRIRHSGYKRKTVGQRPGEERAVPETMVRGSLPERILYNELMNVMHFVPNVDFFFHIAPHTYIGGSFSGFVFPIMKVVLVVKGTGADSYAHIRKDEEHRMAAESHGFEVFEVPEPVIMDAIELDEYMARVFGWYHGGGVDALHDFGQQQTMEGFSVSQISQAVSKLSNLKGELNAP